MTLESAIPLISALGQLIAELVMQVAQSQHMSDEEKQKALDALATHIDETATKVANVKFSDA